MRIEICMVACTLVIVACLVAIAFFGYVLIQDLRNRIDLDTLAVREAANKNKTQIIRLMHALMVENKRESEEIYENITFTRDDVWKILDLLMGDPEPSEEEENRDDK